MVDHSRRISAGEIGLIPPPPEKIPAVLNIDIKKDLHKLGVKDTSKSIFKYHKELCRYPKCRLCMDNCPMYGIDLSLKKPVIAKPCIKHCVFCTLICPTGALEIDDFIKEQAPCYRHTTETLALPNLDILEAQGKFRRLIPKDKIGFDTMFYQVHNGHPKWIIGKGLSKSSQLGK